MAKWYVENLGMIVIRKGDEPNPNFFIADSAKHIMLELYHSTEFPIQDFSKMNHMSLHLAFLVSDIEATKNKLLAKNASVAEDIKKIQSGDQVLTMRDPWGLSIQFIQRIKPLIAFAENRPEHIAINLDDSPAKAKWYSLNLGMKYLREGKAPNYSMFIADINDNFTFELYQQKSYPVIKFDTVHPSSIHLAFMTDNIEALKDKLVKAGAKVFQDIMETPAKDRILMLRDPWGQPIQFVKRAKNMLN
jgi:glyoxylase I family protein